MNQFRISRLKTGMTQEQLAEKLGVTAVAVSSWERGKTKPNVKRLKSVADALNTTVDVLLMEAG